MNLSADGEWKPVVCIVCGARLGLTKAAKLGGAVFCDQLCGEEPVSVLSSHEERDDIIVELHRAGLDQLGIALKMDLTRQRVHQILQSRGVMVGS